MSIKNKILGLSIILMSFLVVASGCGKNNEKDTADNKKSSLVESNNDEQSKEMSSTKEIIDKHVTIDKSNEIQTVHDLDIKITEAGLLDTAADEKDAGKMMLKLTYNIQNNSEEDVGIGAGDFKIMSGEKSFKMMGDDNFGEVIKSKETLEGFGSYLIPVDLVEGEIKFSPVNPQWEDMGNLVWEFTIKE